MYSLLGMLDKSCYNWVRKYQISLLFPCLAIRSKRKKGIAIVFDALFLAQLSCCAYTITFREITLQVWKSGRLDFGRMDCRTVVNFGLLTITILHVNFGLLDNLTITMLHIRWVITR